MIRCGRSFYSYIIPVLFAIFMALIIANTLSDQLQQQNDHLIGFTKGNYVV
jgi:hypothetical protein